jgi:hypothetical protein
LKACPQNLLAGFLTLRILRTGYGNKMRRIFIITTGLIHKNVKKANYGLGFAKINSTQSNNTTTDKNKYRTLSFSVGIPLGK